MLIKGYSHWAFTPFVSRFSAGSAVWPLLLALASVVMFSATAPLTKYLLNSVSPEFIFTFRAFVAGLMSIIVIWLNGWSFPKKAELLWLALSGSGVVIGFPLLLSLGLNNISASEMGVILAGMPLSTALFATLFMREKHPPRFWLFSLVGTITLAAYFYDGAQTLNWQASTVLLLLAAVLFAGVGYAAGAKAAKTLGGWPTICWTLTLFFPVTCLLVIYFTVTLDTYLVIGELADIGLISIFSIFYLALISQWYGFKFWYQAMAEFGAGKIAQLQLLMPFFTLLLAHAFLGDDFSLAQVGFALVIVVSVFMTLKSK